MRDKASLAGRALLLATLAGLAATPILAQGLHIAVIDSDRIVADSVRGKAVLEQLGKLREAKMSEGRALQQEITDLRNRLDEGQLSLAPDKLDELKKEYEDRLIAFRRFQDDADRELGKVRDARLAEIEKQILGIIDQVGQENNYTLIFNKFRSGLVYADEAVDITQQVIQRYDAASAGGGGAGSGE